MHRRTKIAAIGILLFASFLLYVVPLVTVADLEHDINVYMPRAKAEELTALKWSIIRLQPFLTALSVLLILVSIVLAVVSFC